MEEVEESFDDLGCHKDCNGADPVVVGMTSLRDNGLAGCGSKMRTRMMGINILNNEKETIQQVTVVEVMVVELRD
jgi:hypothetical protein